MTKYVLHIGLPKTGTKYLQTNFRRMGGALAAHGIHYPGDWWSGGGDVNHDGLLADLLERRVGKLRNIFDAFNRSEHAAVLLSSEGLSDLRGPEAGLLADLIRPHPVEIIFYCRRWSDWIPSAWQQVVKQGSDQTLPEFVADTLRCARVVTGINFSAVIDLFERAFGRSAIRIVSYSNVTDSGQDLLASFMSLVFGITDVPQPDRHQVHGSMGIFACEIVRCLNALRVGQGRTPDVGTFRRLELLQERRDIKAAVGGLTERMKQSLGEIILDDNAPGMRGIARLLHERFGDLVLNKSSDGRIFEPRAAKVKYVRQDYQLDEHAAHMIRRLSSGIDTLLEPEAPIVARAPDATLPMLRALWGGRAAEYLDRHPALASPPSRQFPVAIDLGFGRDGGATHLLGAGWALPEPNFTWSEGDHSTLRLDRPTQERDYTLLLIVRAFVWEAVLPFQRVKVAVNGRDVGGVEIVGFSVLECRLPWELLAERDAIDIELFLPDAARPSEVSGDPDRRQLGVSLRRAILFSVNPQQPASAPASISEPERAVAVQLLTRFESLGENCEFGLVQRRCGIEPLGLLRFSSTPLPPLLNALRGRFAGMGQPDTIEIEVAASGREYMVFDRRYGFRYHAWVKLGEMAPEAIHAREVRRLPFLIRKLVEDLTDGEKIFVFHGMQPLAEREARELADAIRGYGPGTLLWVEPADAAHPPGAVLPVAPGLLKGHMDRFAPGENAHDLSLDCWLTLCRTAEAMVRVPQAA